MLSSTSACYQPTSPLPWEMEDEKREMGDERRVTRDGRQETGDGKWETGDGQYWQRLSEIGQYGPLTVQDWKIL